MITKRTMLSALVVLTAFGGFGADRPATSAEVTLKALTALPKNRITNTPFWSFYEEVNAKGKGIVQLKYIGGPEAVPVREQMEALGRGIFDLFYGPASYFGGRVPETTAVNGTNKTAMQLRADGALALLSKAYNKKANAEYLGYFGSGYALTIFLTKPAKRTATGELDLTGLKLRGSTVFQPFIKALGANMISVPVPQLYTALERGVVEGAGWTTIVGGAGWGKFLKYQIRPNFYRGDMGIAMNLDAHNKLPAKAREFLMGLVIKHERLAHDWYGSTEASESKRMKAAGMKEIVLSAAAGAKYRKLAYDSLWASMTSRLSKAEVDALQQKFYAP